MGKIAKGMRALTEARNLWLFLLFFLISAGLWLMITLNREYEVDIKVPVRLKNIPEKVIITEQPMDNITVRLKDNGIILCNYVWLHNFLALNVNFDDFAGSDGWAWMQSKDLKNRLEGQLRTSTSIVSFVPDTLDFYYVTGKAYKMAVRVAGDVQAAEQCEIGNVTIKPDSVMVYAPKAVADTMRAVYTEPLSLQALKDCTIVTASIAQGKGIQCQPRQVRVTIPVIPFTEESVDVPVTGVNFPAGTLLRTFPARVNVTFHVNVRRLSTIKTQDFVVQVDYNSVSRAGVKKAVPQLVKVPEGVSAARISPRELDFLIEEYK